MSSKVVIYTSYKVDIDAEYYDSSLWETDVCTCTGFLKEMIKNVLSTYCILLLMALKRMSYNCKGCNVSKIQLLMMYCINAMYCCCRNLGCTLVNSMYLSNIFQNGHPYYVCGIDESVLQHGRPYGRCTTLYR